MDHFDSVIDRAPPLPPSATGAEAYARFQNEPETLVIAVVDAAERPVGLLERDSFCQRMAAEYGRALYSGRPVSSLMHADPLTVDAGASLSAFRREALAARGADLLRGFVVTRAGRYEGVGTALSLLRAAESAGESQADEAARALEQLAQARAEAECAARAKAQFLGVMSHEIRTPLNGVLAVAQLLQRQPLPGDGPAYVRTIVESSETLMRLLTNAIDLSRADTTGLELAPEPTRLRDLMDELQTRWMPRACADGVGLGVTYEGESELAAELDPVRLKQVFDNLIGNALRFTRRGGVEAGLETVREGGRVLVRGHVLDTGPTVPPSALAGLFDPLDGAEREGAGQGAKVALAICRRVLEAMGGRIWAENNPGAGIVFRFEFQARACQEWEQAGATVQPQTPAALTGHILIVDDNATNRMVAQTLVEMFGCTVETVEDGQEAVDAAMRTRFDAVLMDIRMPNMDGVAATRAIRALPGPESSTPIIALTANADPEDARRYLAAGMASVVEKPIKADRLLSALTGALTPAESSRSAAAA